MKYDPTQKVHRGQERVLKNISQTFLDLLQTKAFEQISVRLICERSNYPRSTFYNYFSDKYDLLDYIWSTFADEIIQENRPFTASLEDLYDHFDRIYDLILSHLSSVKAVIKSNTLDGYVQSSARNYLRRLSSQLISKHDVPKTELPMELLSEHCLSILLSVCEWIFIKNHALTKTQAHEMIRKLYGYGA